MQAWWTRVFSSAYGSTAGGRRAASRSAAPSSAPGSSAEAAVGPLRRSWRPISQLPSRAEQALAACARLLPPGRRRDQALRELAHRPREVRSPGRQHDRVAAVDRRRDGAVARQLDSGPSSRAPLSTSRRLRPTFEFARLRTTPTRSRGNESSSSVCRLSRTFLIVGTSRPQSSSSSSVRSSVASIGPWKNGEVSTTITSYDAARDLEQARELRLRDELGVLGPERRRQDVEAARVLRACSRRASPSRARPERRPGRRSSSRARCRA